jgi:hypothetical protein
MAARRPAPPPTTPSRSSLSGVDTLRLAGPGGAVTAPAPRGLWSALIVTLIAAGQHHPHREMIGRDVVAGDVAIMDDEPRDEPRDEWRDERGDDRTV